MARNSIQITFNGTPYLEYVIRFSYYTSPASTNAIAIVRETIKATRAGANQVAQSTDNNTMAANYAAALALDYPTFVVSVAANVVTVTTPNTSPIFDYPNNSSQSFISYVVDTGSTKKTRFLFQLNPPNLFTTPYSVIVPGLASYNNLLVRFNTVPVLPVDSFLDGTSTLTAAAMVDYFHSYLPNEAPAIIPYTSYATGVDASSQPYIDIVVNYIHKMQSTLLFSANPANGTQIIFHILKNNAIVEVVNKTFSTTLSDFGHVLIGANLGATIQNLVTNLDSFNSLSYVDYFASGGNAVLIRYTGTVKDLWELNIAFNNTGVMTLTGTVDYNEPDTTFLVVIPNDALLSDATITRVRSSELYISTDLTPFDTTEFKIFAWTGNLFDIPAEPYIVLKKAKVRAEQEDIYINVSNYFRTGLKGDIFNFLNNSTSYNNLFDTGVNETKWGKVIAVNTLKGDFVADDEKNYFVVDGYIDMLDYYKPQDDVILMTGDTRYVERGSRHAIFFRNNEITQVYYTTNLNPVHTIMIPTSDFPSLNTNFVQGVPVNTSIPGIEWIEYVFDIDFAFHIVRYYLYDACQSEGFQIVFKNRHGMLEGFPVTQRTNRRLQVEGTDYLRNIVDVNGVFDVNDHSRKQYNVKGQDSVTFNTDWLPEYMNAPLKELMMSEEMWIVDSQGNALPVVRIDDNVAFKTQRNDKLIQYTIALKLSHSTIKNFQ